MPLFGPNVKKFRAAKDVEGLIKALERPDIRDEAARALVEIGDPRVVPLLVGFLSPSSTLELGTRTLAREVVRALATVGGLLDILKTGNQEARRGAVIALALFKDPRVFKDPRALDELLSVLSNTGEDSLLREAVAFVLGEIGDPRAVEGLIAFLDAGAVAAQALSKIGDPRGIEPVVGVFIGRLHEAAKKGYAGTPELLDMVVSDPLATETDAVGAFGSAAVDQLKARLQEEGDQFVRLGIESALRRIASKASEPKQVSATAWVADEEAGRRLFTAGAEAFVKALDPDDPATPPFISAILAVPVGTNISHEARTDPIRGGINITFTIDVQYGTEPAAQQPLPSRHTHAEPYVLGSAESPTPTAAEQEGPSVEAVISQMEPDIETGLNTRFHAHAFEEAKQAAALGDVAVEPLIRALSRTSDAHHALSLIGGERAFQALCEELQTGHFQRVAAAATALGRLGDSRALDYLRPHLQSNVAEVYQAVSKAIATIEQAEAGESWIDVDREQPYEQIRRVSALMNDILRDAVQREGAIRWHREFVAAMPELPIPEEKWGNAWSMLGSLIYYLLNPDSHAITEKCLEAAHCWEQCLAYWPNDENIKRLLSDVR
ncbi:MAG: HEAT repeat domain-containing protein [Actinomycetota bacterium]